MLILERSELNPNSSRV